ncbi:MAG: hypothetical protein ABIK61_07135 [candidate division WOR-3 bacterium]
MNGIVCLIILISELNLSGYVESRQYFGCADSVNFFGYSRGWIDLKHSAESFGAQITFDCQVWYDSILTAFGKDNINIARLLMWIGRENRRITVGKQRIYWGVGRVFRPLDIINPINYFEPKFEYAGVNTVLGYYALSNLSNIKLMVRPQSKINQSLLGIRVGSNLNKNDVGLNSFYRVNPKMVIVGGEITGEFKIGYWSEVSYSFINNDRYFKSCTGLDYSFPFNIYAMVEYFYDGSGESNPVYYDYNAFRLGQRWTLAKHYLYSSVSYGYNLYFRPSLNAIINLNDNGFIVMPQILFSVNDNTEFNLGCNFFIGEPTTEFKNLIPYHKQIYLWLKVYF